MRLRITDDDQKSRGSHDTGRINFFWRITRVPRVDSDQIATNGQRHRDPLIRLSNQIFNLKSARPRDRKLGHSVGFGQSGGSRMTHRWWVTTVYVLYDVILNTGGLEILLPCWKYCNCGFVLGSHGKYCNGLDTEKKSSLLQSNAKNPDLWAKNAWEILQPFFCSRQLQYFQTPFTHPFE